MLTSEFAQEMGALIRSLESRVQQEPNLFVPPLTGNFATKDHLDRAIISLIAIRLSL